MVLFILFFKSKVTNNFWVQLLKKDVLFLFSFECIICSDIKSRQSLALRFINEKVYISFGKLMN